MGTTKAKEDQSTPAEDEEFLELRDRYHSEDCPQMGLSDRLEYLEAVPTTGRYAGVKVGITRCCQCGGEEIEPID